MVPTLITRNRGENHLPHALDIGRNLKFNVGSLRAIVADSHKAISRCRDDSRVQIGSNLLYCIHIKALTSVPGMATSRSKF
jgi:hypothetical protein